MYWENYDMRVRMDGRIDRVVLEDILAKREPHRSSVRQHGFASGKVGQAIMPWNLARNPARAKIIVLEKK
jgi:hypothetical protein